jgi:4-hydroxy-tetrahydrodipicolinate reductase
MEKPRLAIVGYGKMGKEVESLAQEKGFEITDIFDIDNPLNENGNYRFDVAIDFTSPDVVIENIRKYAKLKKNAVIGTTGWYEHLPEVKKIVEEAEIGLIYSSNFSVGVQIYFKIIEEISKLMNNFEEYDPFVYEVHHRYKKDSPSGTAITIGKILLENLERKKKISTTANEVTPDSIGIASSRGGEVVGIHSVTFDSVFDSIEIIHRAKNRKGFALGALLASQTIFGRKGLIQFNI